MALQLRRGTNAQRLAMTPLIGELIYVTDYELVTISVTAIVAGTDTLTAVAHGLAVDQQIRFQDVSINGLVLNQVYFVKTVPTSDTFTLSLTLGGATVDITGTFTIPLVFAKTPTTAAGVPLGTNSTPLWIGDGVTVGGIVAASLNLDDLLDVDITSLAEGNTLYYDASTGFWRNTDIITVNDITNKVGINNVNPQYELHITDNTYGFTQFGMTTAERTAILTINDSDDLLSLSYGTTPGATSKLTFDGSTGYQWFNSGRLGVNNSAPTETLDVTGNGKFSGDLTVDTKTLKVNSTTNKVGINNASPQYELHIADSTYGFTQFGMTTAERTAIWTINDTDDLLSLSYGTTPGATGRLTFDGASGNQYFNSGSLGVNNSAPTETLDVTGNGKFSGNVAVNGGDITTTDTGVVNIFNANATTINIGNGATDAVNIGNNSVGSKVLIKAGILFGERTTQDVFNTVATTVNAFGASTATAIGSTVSGTTTIGYDLVVNNTISASSVSVDNRATLDSSTLTTTSTATVALNTTTRNAMTGLVNIIQGSNVHCVNYTALRVDATTALLTVYGEMYNTSSLASFTADVSGGALRLLITPASATSTVFSVVRTSLT